MSHYQQRQLQEVANRAAARTIDVTRHKCFISYHADDRAEVEAFLDEFGTEFIARTVGVTEEDDFIDSEDTDYIMDKIRTTYLGDSTATIVLIGRCTWSRRFVDWEVYSSLRSSKHSSVNGLLAIRLPSVANTGPSLPDRVADNVERDTDNIDIGYARWVTYPTNKQSVRSSIEDAYGARTSRPRTIHNSRPRRVRSSTCP